MTDFVSLSISDHIAVLTLNSPETRNALGTVEQYVNIADACHRIETDMSVRAAVLTAKGKAFCAGGDIKLMAERSNDPSVEAVEDRYHYKHGIHRIPKAVFDLEVPIIAAINGPAIGAGLDFALMCDFRIAAESARFAQSFAKLGIVPGDGGAYLLQKAVGYAKAAELTFTARTIDSAEALACGLVSEVVPDDRLMPRAMELATEIAANPPQVLRMAKRLMREAQTSRFETVLEMSAAFQALAHATQEHRDRITAAVSGLGGR